MIIEEIAKIVEASHPGCGLKKECNTECGICGAKQILKIINEHGYGIPDETAQLPQYTIDQADGLQGDFNRASKRVYMKAQQDMLRAGYHVDIKEKDKLPNKAFLALPIGEQRRLLSEQLMLMDEQDKEAIRDLHKLD